MTDFKTTFECLNLSSEDLFNMSQYFNTDTKKKSHSKRKIAKHCETIHGTAQVKLWAKDYEGAFEQCSQMIRLYPSFWGSYDILSQIYEQKGDFKKANELNYTAAMCNPKDIDKWIECIKNAKVLEGIDKAIEYAKNAVPRANDRKLCEVLIDLLNEGGYEKVAMVKKRNNIQQRHAPPTKQPSTPKSKNCFICQRNLSL